MLIDDILIYLRTLEEHTHHLRTILEVLRENELYTKLKKCMFWLGHVAFFGHVVSNQGVSLDPQKIEAITKGPKHKNST